MFAPQNAPTRDNTGVNEIQLNNTNGEFLLEQEVCFRADYYVSA